MATDQASSPENRPGYLDEYRGNAPVAVAILFIILDVVAVALRFWARKIGKVPWGGDDILIILSVITCLALNSCGLADVYRGGVGHHHATLEATDPSKLLTWAKLTFIIPMVYLPAVVLPRLAILVMYLRIFVKRSDRIFCWVLAGLMIANWLGSAVAGFFICRPLEYFWDRSINGGRCLDIIAWYRWSGLMNITTDLAMLILPLPMVWKMQSSKKVKVGLIITFATGSIGLITSIVRFQGFFASDVSEDGTWTSGDRLVLIFIESGTYLIAACLLTFRPLAVLLWRESSLSSYPLDSGAAPLRQSAGKHDGYEISMESRRENSLSLGEDQNRIASC